MTIVNQINETVSKTMRTLKSIPKYTWGFVVLAFLIGFLIRGGGSDPDTRSQTAGQFNSEQEANQIWTCAMHPQIRLPEPGQCPICAMDLIPLNTGTSDEGPREIKMSAASMQLMEVETAVVKRDIARREVRLSGKVEYDETRLGYIAAWVPGRLEDLLVDYTGIKVKKGDHMVELYSPDLYSAQEELLQALKQTTGGRNGLAMETAQITLEASREKLLLLGLTDEQIQEVEDRGTPEDRVLINSPMAGVVIHKNAVEGMYVKTGTRIYTIADLERVWIVLDAYESDLPWLNFGQEVEFSTESNPGKVFKGRVSFIDPILDDRTRTVKVRVNVPNSDGLLKPGMFVRAVVKSIMDSNGRAINPDMAGKWVSPMHPEIVKDRPGTCDVCGMDLVSAEDLGVVNVPDMEHQPIMIPASAVLWTGKRAVVYVRIPNREEPMFEGREIVLGPRAGDYYIVQSGLQVGERVVVKGNFKIDSAMQISAKPSMMSPEGGVPMTGHANHGAGGGSSEQQEHQLVEDAKTNSKKVSGVFLKALEPLYDAYFQASELLHGDGFKEAAKQLAQVGQIAAGIEGRNLMLSGPDLSKWRSIQDELKKTTEHALHWAEIAAVRKGFETVSRLILELETQTGHSGPDTFYQLFCPMAFDKAGATWIQTRKEVSNPYLGQAMPRCGEVKAEMKAVNGTHL